MIACTLVLNCLATIAFGLVPTDMPNVLIGVRSVIGFSQVRAGARRRPGRAARSATVAGRGLGVAR